MDAPQALVVLSAPPELKEDLIDWLLVSRNVRSFNSEETFGHSSEHGHLSIAEQVRGEEKQIQFQILLPAHEVAAFLDELKTMPHTGIQYWVLPVSETGSL